ncbi:MAG: Zn-dependent hydrolase [Woeseiaceae bacterium]|nr:Zn-dependent hydrolase [Woeseiaceae bacterium]
MFSIRCVRRLCALPVALLAAACTVEPPPEPAADAGSTTAEPRPGIYAEFDLVADLSYYTPEQRRMIVLLIEASEIMDELFWRQAFRDDHAAWLAGLDDPATREFAIYNYGPWDRLAGNRPFVEGFGPKPPGANFYPEDMTVEEFEAAYLPGKQGLYSLVRRDEAGKLVLVPYHVAYARELAAAAELLREAADLAESAQFATYLKLRANALISDEYQVSDLYWLDVKDNEIDVVIGPIETYEDRLFGYRAAFSAYVLLKDLDWSAELARYALLLPGLQENLPVPDDYKRERPGSDSDLNAYDVIYYAGDSNAGSKTIAINLPNDEAVQLEKGTRRLQLKNAMRAKFEKILVPLADELIDEAQREHITFDAFFARTMFHEVAHGLGIKNTITGKGSVRQALKDVASSLEEGKADVLGQYMITELVAAGELGDVDIMDYYVTALASTFRSIRFGASSAHGKANMVRFNYFLDAGAFVRDPATGRYRVDREKMDKAIADFSRRLLILQGDGDYEAALAMTENEGVIRAALQADLDRVAAADIPVDITFNQGLAVLGLE